MSGNGLVLPSAGSSGREAHRAVARRHELVERIVRGPRGAVDRAEALEARGDDARLLRPVGGEAREHPRHERVELLGELRHHVAQAPRGALHHAEQHGEIVLAAVRALAGEALEQHASEREDVGARVDVAIPERLLRRDVTRRPEQHARARDVRPHGAARDAEIDQLHALRIALLEEQVARLQIAVDDAARVHRAERLGGALAEHERLRERERRALEALLEALSVEPLHHEEALAAVELAVRDVADDAVVREARDELRLAEEARGVARIAPVQDLQRDGAAPLLVVRSPHGAHPAGSGQALDAESSADQITAAHRTEV